MTTRPPEVPVHALKSGLSRYLKQATEGQTIIVTSHNKAIARLTAIPPDEPAAGDLSGPTGKHRKPALRTPVALSEGGRSLSDLVLDERR